MSKPLNTVEMHSTAVRRAGEKNQRPALWLLMGISAVVLFICGSVKHGVYQSAAFDLGIFDQALYLLSQGATPFSSITGYHILADHAAFVLYPLSLLYGLNPNIHWLFLVQAISLSLACYPTFRLAGLAGLTQSQSLVISAVGLLYPVIFNTNLFDFHPEVIAFPAILWMVLAARSHRLPTFCVALVITLSCKDALALTVAAMGLWMILFEGRSRYGFIALVTGVAWLLIATQVVMPLFSPAEAASGSRYLARYTELGNSAADIFLNVFRHPEKILSRILSLATLEYFVLLCAPIVYVFLSRSAKPLGQLMPAIPVLAMNVLANSAQGAHRNLVHHYSLPILPFILLAIIGCFQAGARYDLFSTRTGHRFILGWAVVAFLALSRLFAFFGPYYEFTDTSSAVREASTRITDNKSVLTTAEIVPHLTHRPLIDMTDAGNPADVSRFDYVLLNTRHPGWLSNPSFSQALTDQLNSDEQFKLAYQHDDVYLFIQQN